jgi:lipid II:glycine glycyltransferase (peptidoglycan interpeptide bridge formation enzyme)
MTVGLGPPGAATSEGLLASPATWDAFVASRDLGSYLQTTAWATVKAANRWQAERLVAGTGDGAVAAQVLTIARRPLPWRFGYVPRGPVAATWTPETVLAMTAALRYDPALARQRVSHIRIDPPLEDTDGSAEAVVRTLAAFGWRRAPAVQPAATRLVDLSADEADLWGELRGKWRQYITRARRNGIRVVEADGDRLGAFYRIYRETAARTSLLIRTEQAYRDVWDAFRPAGMVRLLLAVDTDDAPVAALFLVRCGGRAVELYGGMTAVGAATRANYLLKWEAMRTSRLAGATTYDMWGLVNPGIDQFKAGFGGREVHYIGAWDLVLDPVGYRVIQVATGLRSVYVDLIRRRGRRGATAEGTAPVEASSL